MVIIFEHKNILLIDYKHESNIAIKNLFFFNNLKKGGLIMSMKNFFTSFFLFIIFVFACCENKINPVGKWEASSGMLTSELQIKSGGSFVLKDINNNYYGEWNTEDGKIYLKFEGYSEHEESDYYLDSVITIYSGVMGVSNFKKSGSE